MLLDGVDPREFNIRDVLADIERGQLSREIFVSETIFREELDNLFTRCWLFIGHESQIPDPGDFFVSRMGVDSVLMARDNEGIVRVLLNSCRHRGMKVCRYDVGNTTEFRCPFHGWTYSIDGTLVSYPGELYGVPQYTTAYRGKLDKKKWGLISCPNVTNYKGLIFASWDRDVLPFEEYLGDFHYWIDNLIDALDGTPGGAEVFQGVQKWRVRSNWKFVAENFVGDMYHASPTHDSVEAIGIGPGGRDATRHGFALDDPRNVKRAPETSFTKLGHGSCSALNDARPYPESFKEPALRAYFKDAWEKKVARFKADNKPWALGASTANTMFPNMSFLSNPTPKTILVAHPISAQQTELWRWYIVDKSAPEEVREWIRHFELRHSGPAGFLENDDMENWDYATEASAGIIARRFPYNYEMGLDMSVPSEYLRDAVESLATPTEENARNFYRSWARITAGESWSSILGD